MAQAATSLDIETYSIPKVTIRVNETWCKGCTICVEFCPKAVLKMNQMDKVVVVDLEVCTKCMKCELLCPDFAITVE